MVATLQRAIPQKLRRQVELASVIGRLPRLGKELQ